MQQAYLEHLMDEPTVLGANVMGPGGAPLYRQNPVEETAMNSAIRSAKVQILEEMLNWNPVEEVEEENDGD